MDTRHIPSVGLVLALGLLFVHAPAPASAQALDEPASAALRSREAHVPPTGLRILVSALPAGLPATIEVSGPHGARHRLTHSGLLKLAPGRYLVSAAPVPGKTGTYYPTTARVHELLRTDHVTTVKVSYATLIPNSTHIVPASGTVALVGEPTGPRVLTLSGPTAATVSVGQFLASGPSAAAPDGYLVKVTSVTREGETAVFDVENATLLQAVPSGEIDAEQTLEPPAGASALAPESALRLGHYRAGPPVAHTAGFSLSDFECSAGFKVDFEPPSIKPSIAFHASWGFFTLNSASLTAKVTEKMGIHADGEAGAECKTKDPVALLPHAVQLPVIDIQVGPFPVVITPTLQLYLSGKASIKANVSTSLGQQATAEVGAEYNHGSFKPIAAFNNSFAPSLTAEGDASAEVALTPTVDTLVYGVTGPTFDVGAIAKATANTNSTPWWKLEGCLEAGFGFTFSPLGLDWSDPHLYERCRTLLSAKTPPPAGSSTGAGSGGGGGAGGGGGGGGKKGELCKKYETVGFETKCVQK
jgi:hypothetical protein